MKRHVLLTCLMAILVGLVIIETPSSLDGIGRSDFNAYWSASYLLSRSRDFTDRDMMLAIEREHTQRTDDYAMMTWNPPWLLAMLLPLTVFTFSKAAFIWLLVNIAMIFASSVMIWRLWANGRGGYRVFLAPVIAFAFSSSLVVLIVGQVTGLVLLGLALYLLNHHRSNPFLAGTALTLVLVKPHLLYITLTLIFLEVLSARRWRFFAGFCLALLFLTLIVFGLRPTVLSDYVGLLQEETQLLWWHVPTLGGIVQAYTGSSLGKYVGLIVLPITAVVWWARFRESDMQIVVGTATILSLMTAPFGWSYDLVLLLIPIIQLVAFSIGQTPRPGETILLLLLLLFLDGITFYLRVHANSEVFFFWIAPMIGILYLWMLAQRRNPSLGAAPATRMASASS